MRQWLVNPKIMCKNHLSGEHVEHHMFLGALKGNMRLDGYIKHNLLAPKLLYSRHKELAEEMVARGWNHKSPISKRDCEVINKLTKEQVNWKIDREASLLDLIDRCPKCRERLARL